MGHCYEVRNKGTIRAAGFSFKEAARDAAQGKAKELGWTEWFNVGHVIDETTAEPVPSVTLMPRGRIDPPSDSY